MMRTPTNWPAWLADVKTATSSAYPLYDLEGEPLPRVGAYGVVLDSQGNAVCIVQTVKVTVMPFREVPASHAYREGEGDRTLGHWRQVHERFFAQELQEAGLAFDEIMPVVCEEFRRVY
ncbi:ASCH domain-containing protein [Bifidobacterium cuniculi]|uniref:ASCH domain protein n=1 Tax=Bifidobacterium cuniculi TaxID=1688 RepID=A0A087ATI7_9BIFI|nr:ASCH domain-containing protein [Bifidobacterium cuniculi]KFI62087.1 ASCH domain protein [Bifidobacterium cuniculi]